MLAISEIAPRNPFMTEQCLSRFETVLCSVSLDAVAPMSWTDLVLSDHLEI